MARLLIVIGLIIVGVGVLLLVAPRVLSWFGHLPGDIRVERDGFSLWIPITSMVVASLLLTALVNLLLWLFDRFG